MNFDSKMPIYLQIMDEIKRWIVTDVYQPSQKIPSVRELAVEFGVNPNTVQRALSELERSGLVYSQRTNGRFITEDTSLLKETREELVRGHIRQFFEQMRNLGLSDEETLEIIQKYLREKNYETNS